MPDSSWYTRGVDTLNVLVGLEEYSSRRSENNGRAVHTATDPGCEFYSLPNAAKKLRDCQVFLFYFMSSIQSCSLLPEGPFLPEL